MCFTGKGENMVNIASYRKPKGKFRTKKVAKNFEPPPKKQYVFLGHDFFHTQFIIFEMGLHIKTKHTWV